MVLRSQKSMDALSDLGRESLPESQQAFTALAPSRTTPNHSKRATGRGYPPLAGVPSSRRVASPRFPVSVSHLVYKGSREAEIAAPANTVPSGQFLESISSCFCSLCRCHDIRGTGSPFPHPTCSKIGDFPSTNVLILTPQPSTRA